MTFQLPKLELSAVRDVADLSARFIAFAHDVYEFLRLMPTIEFKTITTVGNFPLYVETQTPKAVGVLRVQSYETRQPGVEAAYIPDTSIQWRLSDDPYQRGIVITSIGGQIGPEELTMVLLILGERA
jgi:hypothetical protein